MIDPSRPQILCIDNSDSRTPEWIERKLAEANVICDVISESSGREGFRLLNTIPFDLCVLDYALPDMTGAQLCSLMGRMLSTVPILFFTPMDRNVDREKAMDAGAAAYLVKPDDLDLFVDTATHLLKRRSPRLFALPPRIPDLARAA